MPPFPSNGIVAWAASRQPFYVWTFFLDSSSCNYYSSTSVCVCLFFLLFLSYTFLKVAAEPFWKEAGGDCPRASLTRPVSHLLKVGSSNSPRPAQARTGTAPRAEGLRVCPGPLLRCPHLPLLQMFSLHHPWASQKQNAAQPSWFLRHRRLLLKGLCSPLSGAPERAG